MMADMTLERTDAEWLQVYVDQGSDLAFEQIVSRHGPMVYRHCFRLLHDAHEAKDTSQAVFIVLAKQAGALRKNGNLTAWLYGVTRNVCRHALRCRMNRQRREEEGAIMLELERDSAQAIESQSVVLDLVYRELGALTSLQRQAVILRYIEGRREDNAAGLAGCSVDALHRRATDGIAKLRQRLAKRGIALGGVALASLLTSEASAAIPETLLPSILATVKTAAATTAAGTAATTTAVMLAKGVMKAMFIAKVKMVALVTAAAIAVGGAGVTAVVAVDKEQVKAAAAATATATNALAAQPDLGPGVIIPRTCDAQTAFEDLARKGGPRVVLLFDGTRFTLRAVRSYADDPRRLLVPAELRFVRVDARNLIEAVAASHGLKTAWLQDGQRALLYEGATDSDVERARADIASTDATVRRDAAWRAGWLRDPRAVKLLVKAAKDMDAETVRQALTGLRRMGWKGVVALEEDAADLLEAELLSADDRARVAVAEALEFVSGEKALPLLEKLLADKEYSVRSYAVAALGRMGGEKALAFIEKMLAAPDETTRGLARSALMNRGGEKAWTMLEQACADPDVGVRWGAVNALANKSGDRALPLIERALSDKNMQVRCSAARALGYVGGEKALALLEKAFADKDSSVRLAAAGGLGRVGGERALPLIAKLLDDKDCNYWSVADVLVCAGGEKALPLLEKMLADDEIHSDSRRRAAVMALGHLGGEKALALLEKSGGSALVNAGGAQTLPLIEKDFANTILSSGIPTKWYSEARRNAVRALGRVGGERAMAWFEQACADPDEDVRQAAWSALIRAGGQQALPLMEKALTSQIVDVRRSAVAVLDSVNGAPSDRGRIQDPAARKQDRAAMLDSVGGEQALLLLEKALADPDRSVQLAAFGALSRLGGTKTLALQEKALPLLERALADPERLMGLNAAKLLAGLGGAKALALLEKALPLLEEAQIATNYTVRGEAMSVRASLGEKGIPLIEKALGAEAFDVRRDAAQGLGNVSMEKALPLIAKALADPNARVRSAAFFGFASRSRADMEKALPLLEKALADPDGLVRQCAIGELGRMGGEKARDLLLGRLAGEKDAGLLRMIRSVLQEGFPGAPETRQGTGLNGALK